MAITDHEASNEDDHTLGPRKSLHPATVQPINEVHLCRVYKLRTRLEVALNGTVKALKLQKSRSKTYSPSKLCLKKSVGQRSSEELLIQETRRTDAASDHDKDDMRKSEVSQIGGHQESRPDITRDMGQIPSEVVLAKMNEKSIREEEDRYPPISQFKYPSAPRMLAKTLPPSRDDDENHDRDIAVPNDPQLLPDFLLFQDELLPGVDARIYFHERNRCVAQPTITFMPEYPGYLWGAVTSHVTSRDGMRVHFEEITEPATNPAVSRMKITTGLSENTSWLEVERQGGTPYITVVDIQRTVIEWMKETSRGIDPAADSPRFSSWVKLTDEDGQEVELEVWIWRGLKPLDSTLERWELQFARDEVSQ